MSENDRKLLAEILLCARRFVNDGTDIESMDDIEDVERSAKALEAALDRYDLRAEDRIA